MCGFRQFARFIHKTFVVLVSLAVLAGPGPAHAADASFFAGPAVFDMASVGATLSSSLRLTQPVTRWLSLEAVLGIAFPRQRHGKRAVLYVPEAGLLLSWPRDGWTPYIGAAFGGGGFDETNARADWEIAVSGAVGATIPWRHRLSLRPEIRIHGFGDSMSASLTDFHIGLAWHL